MADRQTGSIWTHFDGTILTGSLADTGLALDIQPMLQTTWEEWLTLHPKTLELDFYEEFADRHQPNFQPGGARLRPSFQQTILNWDDRLPDNELVLGANVCDQFRAYVLADFSGGLSIVNDTMDGIPIVIFMDGNSLYALAFQASVDEELLIFSVIDGAIVDDAGNTWDISGKATSGPLAGTKLLFVTSFITEWYGWAAYHPDTSIYGR